MSSSSNGESKAYNLSEYSPVRNAQHANRSSTTAQTPLYEFPQKPKLNTPPPRPSQSPKHRSAAIPLYQQQSQPYIQDSLAHKNGKSLSFYMKPIDGNPEAANLTAFPRIAHMNRGKVNVATAGEIFNSNVYKPDDKPTPPAAVGNNHAYNSELPSQVLTRQQITDSDNQTLGRTTRDQIRPPTGNLQHSSLIGENLSRSTPYTTLQVNRDLKPASDHIAHAHQNVEHYRPTSMQAHHNQLGQKVDPYDHQKSHKKPRFEERIEEISQNQPHNTSEEQQLYKQNHQSGPNQQTQLQTPTMLSQSHAVDLSSPQQDIFVENGKRIFKRRNDLHAAALAISKFLDQVPGPQIDVKDILQIIVMTDDFNGLCQHLQSLGFRFDKLVFGKYLWGVAKHPTPMNSPAAPNHRAMSESPNPSDVAQSPEVPDPQPSKVAVMYLNTSSLELPRRLLQYQTSSSESLQAMKSDAIVSQTPQISGDSVNLKDSTRSLTPRITLSGIPGDKDHTLGPNTARRRTDNLMTLPRNGTNGAESSRYNSVDISSALAPLLEIDPVQTLQNTLTAIDPDTSVSVVSAKPDVKGIAPGEQPTVPVRQPPASKRLSSESPEDNNQKTKSRRIDDQLLQLEGNYDDVEFKKYCCRWKDCTAILHNFETLQRHLQSHKKTDNYGCYSCKWKGCYQDRSEENVEEFKRLATGNEWEDHVKGHIEVIKLSLGVGPAVIESGMLFNLSIQEILLPTNKSLQTIVLSVRSWIIICAIMKAIELRLSLEYPIREISLLLH
jgi:hypothetical protein